ncbi:MAG: hypothetical protein ISS92_02785 [Candidatus Omnitrophica bacterium]|nr:hypothetical protein [Candidatus Omnitrophota bacterium]
MKYRIDKDTLLNTLSVWNSLLKKKVHLIACGGTALTLLNIKESTKDVDFLVPEESEYKYLVRLLEDLGYKNTGGAGWATDKGFIFDLYPGKKIFMTELLESPLKIGNNISLKEFEYIYVGILNFYDLIISKIFRYSTVDIDDCLVLFRAKKTEINIEELKERFFETSSYDVSDEKNKKHLTHFLNTLRKEGLIS